MILVIVESPAKAKTINRYLGSGYRVLSSFGHVRDLPKSKLGVDVLKNYEPVYAIPHRSAKALSEIKKVVKNKTNPVNKVILATDEDREGEAIAFHLQWIIKRYASQVAFERITFHEITQKAIKEALKKPRQIDQDLFNAQQARRILDRLVGYKLSPLLWKKIRYGLSAGRVQSVTLRLIVERERERNAFRKEEYWSLKAEFKKKTSPAESFLAELKSISNKKIDKFFLKNKAEAQKIETDLKKTDFVIEKVERKTVNRWPEPPYKTSSLQRDAANKLGYSAKQTMMIAQRLYEGIKLEKGNAGLITYMRTDSLNVSEEALQKATETIAKNWGKEYSLPSPRRFTNKAKNAQEAHEAIRPTFPHKTPQELKKFLDPKQFKLYDLIWKRFIASQMKEAEIDRLKVMINGGEYGFIAEGSSVRFDGFLKIYGEGNLSRLEKSLPPLNEKESVSLIKTISEQHFTQPPARFTDASLIKVLEEAGIGRPSTYAPTLSLILTRGYVEKDDQRQYVPQEIGFLVSDFISEHFPKIVDLQFTAQMESDLDEIAEGNKHWVLTIDQFFRPFAKDLEEKSSKIAKYQKELSQKCPECGKPLLEKFGRFGKFFACSGYPECKFTEDPNKEETEKLKTALGKMVCEKCGKEMEIKRGKWGPFWGCSGYPECKGIKRVEKSTGIKCPLCQKGEIIEKKSARGIFWACNNYPACKNAMNGKPTGEKCPKCGDLLLENPKTKTTFCSNKKCGK
jgi:DNA topoisomerase-1